MFFAACLRGLKKSAGKNVRFVFELTFKPKRDSQIQEMFKECQKKLYEIFSNLTYDCMHIKDTGNPNGRTDRERKLDET